MRKVTVEVRKDGTLATSFDCFQGSECLKEAEKIKAGLAALGVEVDPDTFHAKEELTGNTVHIFDKEKVGGGS